MDKKLINLFAELLNGLQVPLSIGVLGAAREPLTKIRDELRLFGWPTEIEHKKALDEYVNPTAPPSSPGWISVEDELPESETYCRVKLKNKEKTFDSHFYRDSYGEWWSSMKNIYDRNYTTRVTHWMPLLQGP